MRYFVFLTTLSFLVFGIFFIARPAHVEAAETSAVSSKLIPECVLTRDTAAMKQCDNVNVFIWLAINIGIYLFGFIGALALLFFIYGGVILIISQGNQEKIKQGTSAMTAAIIGLVIAFSAYALISFLSSTIGVKAEKSLNFVETVYAAEGCMIGGYCEPLMESDTECPPENRCTPGDITAEVIEEYLNEPVGQPSEDAAKQEGVGTLKKGAAKLNPMNIGAPSDLLSRGINVLIAFMGSIAIVLYIYAGFIWMSASGNSEKVAKAKSILVWTTLGVLAMGGSYMVVRTILERVG